MKTRFSPEQLAAIETEGNVIVSAGAGSGKTTVMVERAVRKLVAGHVLDKMLIVTFTRASAADIRVKLAERLTRLKREGGSAERAVAERALEALPVCNIGTLHGFCQKLIRSYYYAAGVDPAAALADEGEAAALRTECIRRAVSAARDSGDEVARAVLDALSGRRDDEGSVAAIKNVLDFAQSLSDTRGYLSVTADDRSAYSALDAIIEERRSALLAEARLLNADIAAVGFETIRKAAGELIGYIEHGFEVSGTVYRGKDAHFLALNERFKTLKKECRAFRDDLSDVETAKTVESAPYARALCDIALKALDDYEARKAVRGKIDYSDLEHGALNVLKDENCMRELAQSVDFVFIDEYQDVNPLQAEIASLLKNGAGAEMFLVGDVKQSIYAFRRCNPKFFKSALSDSDYIPVMLNRNYRSAEEIIDFVNTVFDGVMTDGFGGADYCADRLVCGNSFHGKAEFLSVKEEQRNISSESSDGQTHKAPKSEIEAAAADCAPPTVYSVVGAEKGVEKSSAEARLIVDLILDYAEEGHSFGSVAVLVRSARTSFCEELVRLMRADGIPCNLGRKSGVKDYPEAELLLRIARCVDNRFDDIALYAALRSPMGGFDDEELLEIAAEGESRAKAAGVKPESGFGSGRKSYYFWQKTAAYVGEYSARLDKFFARREKLAEFARKHDAADTLGKITSEIEFFQYVFETGGNPSAVEAVIALAASKKCALSAFLTDADGAELNVGDGGDAVTVTTVHASKGLEYDFVIVADTDKRFNMRDAFDKCMAADGGVAVKFPDEKTRALKPSARWLLEKYAVPDRLRAEELRLFYVALTRAKKRLAVLGNPDGTSRVPERATCECDFMKNVLPTPVAPAVRKKCVPPADKPLDSAVVEAVRARIADGRKYALSDAPVKTCVTAIAQNSDEDYTASAPVLTYDDYAADGGDGARFTADAAARRGTAYHRAMELIDFDNPDTEAVKAAMPDAELVNFGEIAAAVRQMKKLTAGAKAYFKERYFIADLDERDGTLVQGVIDLLIINADGSAAIVDYKTTAPERLKNENYLKQLSLYAAAVEKSSPLKVSATYLYSFALEKFIKCERT